jgi:hypothetical protein
MPRLACLTRGRLVLLNEGGEPRDIESPYAEQVRTRERQIRRKNAWKTEGSGARFMGAGRAVLWGQAEDELPPARFVGVSRGRNSEEVFYAITTGVVSGIFGRVPRDPDEQRIFHDAETNLDDLDFSPVEEAFAFSVGGKGGSSSVAVLADDGRGVCTVTEGDVVDRAPRWARGTKGEIVYASAGIGRTQAGGFGGLGPFAIHRLSLAGRELEVLIADPKYDYLAPVSVSAEELYAIRRPYRDAHAPVPIGRVVLDALLAPFRLLFALFEFLSFFTARYTGKPLLTSGNARQKAADARKMMVWGNLVDVSRQADQQAEGEARGGKESTYELVSVSPKGVRSIARGVLAFDVAGDGTIFYSTGRTIKRMTGGKAETFAELAEVERISVCD